MAPEAKAQIIDDLLEVHFEELAFLWERRIEAICSPIYTLRAFRELDERIDAHTSGLLVGGKTGLPLLEQGLADKDPSNVFAAAYALLRLGDAEAANTVIDRFMEAEGDTLAGLRRALAHAPLNGTAEALQDAAAGAPPVRAVAACEILAFHGQLEVGSPRLKELIQDKSPSIRAAAWRVIGLLDSIPEASMAASVTATRPYSAAIKDQDTRVRIAALGAAAWTRQKWLLEHCRSCAATECDEQLQALVLVAVLGDESDMVRMISAGRLNSLGPGRFRILGAYGHPNVVDQLLTALDDEDPFTSVAAGLAFTKITGVDIESDDVVTIPPKEEQDPDEIDEEFLDELVLPDPEKARAHWAEASSSYGQGSRWSRGVNLDTLEDEQELPPVLDMESCSEAALRSAAGDKRRNPRLLYPEWYCPEAPSE